MTNHGQRVCIKNSITCTELMLLNDIATALKRINVILLMHKIVVRDLHALIKVYLLNVKLDVYMYASVTN